MDDDSEPYQSSTNMTSQELDNTGSLEKFKRQYIDQKECDIINVSYNQRKIFSSCKLQPLQVYSLDQGPRRP